MYHVRLRWITAAISRKVQTPAQLISTQPQKLSHPIAKGPQVWLDAPSGSSREHSEKPVYTTQVHGLHNYPQCSTHSTTQFYTISPAEIEFISFQFIIKIDSIFQDSPTTQKYFLMTNGSNFNTFSAKVYSLLNIESLHHIYLFSQKPYQMHQVRKLVLMKRQKFGFRTKPNSFILT